MHSPRRRSAAGDARRRRRETGFLRLLAGLARFAPLFSVVAPPFRAVHIGRKPDATCVNCRFWIDFPQSKIENLPVTLLGSPHMPDANNASYLRCSHCRGFYETARPHCRFCGKSVPIKNDQGQEKVYRDRATCRAIQIAEYEQLPPEAMEDPMRPDPEELGELCGCLHCRDGKVFEAVEMRWMANERMWACPCTTCGGRGFHFDIHPIKPKWECNQCRHKWFPPDGNSKPSNCKCPECGSTSASGWFDEEYDVDEVEAMSDEEFAEKMGFSRHEFDEMKPLPPEELAKFDGPAGREEADDPEGDFPPMAEMEYMAQHPEDGVQPDDIDYPHERPPRPDHDGQEHDGLDDDIPY
jgi:hypothetical protein